MTEPVGVLGCGTMGSGIAIVALSAGRPTVVLERDDKFAREGHARIKSFLDRGLEKKKLTTAEHERALSNLKVTPQEADLRSCRVVIEAVWEDVRAKQEIFSRLSEICPQETIFLSNTSTLSVTGIAAGCGRPDRLAGMHFCNPAPLMKLVEVSRALQTSDETFRAALDFARSLSKIPVATADRPGFIVNRLLIPFENDCIRALEHGVGSADEFDRAVREQLGYPMGTFELLDIIGLDIHLAVAESLWEQMRDPAFAPPPRVRKMVEAGYLGTKTGRGFYEYEKAGTFGAKRKGASAAAEIPDRVRERVEAIRIGYLTHALHCADENLASIDDIDVACKLGLGHPKGPFEILGALGVEAYRSQASRWYGATKDLRFAPPPDFERLL